jgi:hypothetical protein
MGEEANTSYLMWSLWPKAKQMDGKEGRREEEEGQI